MSEQLALSLLTPLPSRYDLPPSWDGQPVEWSEWTGEARSSLLYHAPPEDLACDQCGSIDEPKIAFGKRPPPEGATYESTREKTTKSGRKYSVAIELPAWPIWDLVASRCRHCESDAVHDRRTDQHWELDDSDYGDKGSVEP